MKIVTLTENTSVSRKYKSEHGLSLYVETGGYKILFDMGQTDAFAENARKLGIDLSQVDFAVLSHGHYDHGGGLDTFLQINAKAPVYIHKLAFGSHYNSTEKYIGLHSEHKQESRLIFTEGTVFLAPGMKLTDCNDQGWTFPSWGLSLCENGAFRADPFAHEQYLQITEGEKRILISGCSHKGIGNLAEHFKPDVLIGGFHLSKQEDAAALSEMANRLKKSGTVYYTGHCTGEKQFAIMKGIMDNQLEKLSTGITIEV